MHVSPQNDTNSESHRECASISHVYSTYIGSLDSHPIAFPPSLVPRVPVSTPLPPPRVLFGGGGGAVSYSSRPPHALPTTNRYTCCFAAFHKAMFVHLPDVAVVDREDMSVMVKYIAQSIMAGTIGLLPESCQSGRC